MSDEGEKTCPLCAEEMDLTDQQLKPCKCGYEICVWCWHHIMDMAEKDETEGRCPACRTAYNKEKIVGTRANCGRMALDMNVDKKHRAHKGKSKTSEGRKQLNSVRVIQRNLVYVVGLPLSFAEEEQLLQRRDHFGQYGKVMKVSVSRTATGAIQHFANSTCSVYITYSKEEEAVRCIQSVHGFILDGRPLRACFGTTKYCHAWLRNMPCSNPDCLYLHEVGSQEDSFTKDEIISAYTRSRVQQITGASNSMQRRSGTVLPPPTDEYYNNGPAQTGKPITKSAVNTNNSLTSVSPPNSSSGRSAALPAGASWGTRPSSNHSLPSSIQVFDVPINLKSDTSNGPVALCTAVASPSQVPPLRTNSGKKFVQNEEGQEKSRTKALEPLKNQSNADKPIAVSENSVLAQSKTSRTNREHNGTLPFKSPSNIIHVINPSATSTEPVLDKGSNDVKDSVEENMCSNIISMSIHDNQQLPNGYTEDSREKKVAQTQPLEVSSTTEEVNLQCEVHPMDVKSDLRLEVLTQTKHADLHEVEDDLLSFNNQRVKDPEIISTRVQDFSNMLHQSKQSFHHPSIINPESLANVDLNRQVVNRDSNLIVSEPKNPIGHSENRLNFSGISNGGYSSISPSKDRGSVLRGYDGEVASESVNAGEGSIITKFLAMDFDPWDDTLTSFTQGSFGVPGSWKAQTSNQSKFSFAREQEPMSQVSEYGQPIGHFEQPFRQHPASHGFSSNNDLRLEKPVSRNGFPSFNGSTEPGIFANGHLSMNKSAASRSQISAPPGFSAPNRAAAPPGFTPHERTEQFFDVAPANHMLDASSLSRNQYQTPLSTNCYNNGDIEFMDPAILAVGKGTLAGGFNNAGLVDIMSSYTPQCSTYEESRFSSYQQRSLPPHQNPRYSDMGDQFSMLGDAYGHPSRAIEHAVANNRSPFSTIPQSRNGINSNGQWDIWNQIQGGNNLGMAELLRNERLGYNNFYPSYEDSKIRMPTSGNLYNGTYEI